MEVRRQRRLKSRRPLRLPDSARWTYDELRHCQMGYERLMAWGLEPAEIPLGTYIYESAAGEDPIYLLGMLYFFETKNIRHKPARTTLSHLWRHVERARHGLRLGRRNHVRRLWQTLAKRVACDSRSGSRDSRQSS